MSNRHDNDYHQSIISLAPTPTPAHVSLLTATIGVMEIFTDNRREKEGKGGRKEGKRKRSRHTLHIYFERPNEGRTRHAGSGGNSIEIETCEMKGKKPPVTCSSTLTHFSIFHASQVRPHESSCNPPSALPNNKSQTASPAADPPSCMLAATFWLEETQLWDFALLHAWRNLAPAFA